MGDDLIINGSKMWITNGCQADWMAMLAVTREDKPHKNKSIIIVPLKGTKGVTVAKSIKKLGNHSSDTGLLFFEDVRVPKKNIIGEEGMGFMYQMMQFQDERLGASISAYPACDRMINMTIEYCKTRKAFGRPLIDNQVIQHTLAQLQTESEMLRSLCYRAADGFMRGEDMTYLASMAKLLAGQLSRKTADQCLQYFGGMGYTAEMAISRCYRDARLMSIAGGADEIMLYIISKYMDICKN